MFWLIFVGLLISALVIFLTIIGVMLYRKQDQLPKTYDILPVPKKEHLEFKCINLPFRRKKFERMHTMLQKQGIKLDVFDAIDGKHLLVQRYQDKFLTKKYKKHFETSPKQLGHLGATFSHLGILQLIIDDQLGRTVVFEDDCIVKNGFNQDLRDCIQRMDLVNPDWDMLQLGFSCGYDSYSKCHQNDDVPIQAGKIIKLGYAIGLFGYVVNGEKGARNMLNNMFPIDWHVDHHYQTLNTKGKVNLYGTIPNIVFHPGKIEISSFDEVYNTNYTSYVSDTNL